MSEHIDKSALIAKINQLEGLTTDERSALLSLLRQHKKYGLVWEEKEEAVEERLRDELPILREVKERAIVRPARPAPARPDLQSGRTEYKDLQSDNSAPNHIIIEGDNLEALTVLSYTHEGKIDVIYIDPPYNTGNKDFVYNDSYVDTEDTYRHSKWLSFMNKRLKIAKRLLSDRGVIFISIDENELGPLRLLGDEIFNSNNFVGQWNWFKAATPPALSKKIKRNIEYVLSWQKGGNNDTFRGVQKTSSSNDPFTKPQNSYKTLLFPAHSITCKIQDGVYPASVYGTSKFPNVLLDDLIVENGKNKNCVRFRNRFIWIQPTLDKNISEGLYIELSKRLVLSYKRGEYAPEVPPNLIDLSVGVDTTENAGRHLADIFNGVQPFDYPKPVSLIKYILNFPCYNDITILDFFAGSGTTLHATMQLNAEDGGHRQCILVTNNENGICENVTYERNKRVINGYITPKGQHVEGLHNNSLRYYKTDFISRDRTMRNMRQLMDASTDMLCIKEDLYTEQKMFGKWRINPKVARYFNDGCKHMLVVYDERAVEQLPAIIAETDFGTAAPPPSEGTEGRLKIYIFSPERYAFDDDFYEVQDKVQLVALPAAIYDAYQKVLPRRKPQMLSVAEEVKKVQTNLFGEEEEKGGNQ